MKAIFVSLFLILFTIGIKAQSYQAIISKKEPVVDTFYSKYIIKDDYRWLENVHSDEVKEWIKKENKQSKKYLSRLKGRSAIYDEISKYSKVKALTVTRQPSDYKFRFVYYNETSSAVLQMKGPGYESYKTLVDPNELSQTDVITISNYWVSEDNQYLAYQFSRNGSDKHEVKVVTLPQGKALPDYLHDVMFSNIVWYHDGFFYSTFENKSNFGVTTHQKVYYHKLETGQFMDTLVFERPHYPENTFTYKLSTDGDYFLLKEKFTSKDKYNIFYFNVKKDHFRVKPLLVNLKTDFNIVSFKKDKFVGYTEPKAGTGMIVEVDPLHPMKWKALTPSFSEARLHDALFLPDYIAAIYQTVTQPILAILNYSGVVLSTLKMPLATTAYIDEYDSKNNELFFHYSSYIVPPIVNHINLATYKVEPYKKTEYNFDFKALTFEQIEYPSNDSTMIPMTLVYKKGIKKNGNNPTLLEAYGGFGLVSTPHFNPEVVYFVEHGGVYAFAYIRGGGEKGKKWADAGRGVNKQQSFDDFIAAAEYLIKQQLTRPEKLAIHGASNGGLVVAVAAIRRPKLFKVVVPEVAPTDMLRFEKFTIGSLHHDEYGTITDSLSFTRLLKYSPYQNIKEDVNYPAMLILTSDNDDRVPPLHSYKFAARLQSRPAQTNPVLLKVEKDAGHNGAVTYLGLKKSVIDYYSFIMNTLNN